VRDIHMVFKIHFKKKYIFLAACFLLFACAGVQPGTQPRMEQVTHLSEEWARSLLLEMKKDKAFIRAVQGLNFTLQHEVREIPGRRGEILLFYTRYRFDGPLSVGIGPAMEPEVVFSGTYHAWEKLHSGQITLDEALRQRLITFTGEYQVVALFLERLKRYGKPLSEIYQRVPTRWLGTSEESPGE